MWVLVDIKRTACRNWFVSTVWSPEIDGFMCECQVIFLAELCDGFSLWDQ